MIIHEKLVNEELCKYYGNMKGNGELKEYDSLTDFLKNTSLISFRNVRVKPLTKEEVEKKRLERIYDLANTLR